jgi:flagellar protein FliS
MTPIELAYRKTAIEGTSGFGLLVALYDTLAGNLRRAAEAERSNDLEKRTTELNHALLVIAHLEDWVRRGSSGDLADYLVVFYRSMRCRIIEAQARRSAEILEQQMTEVLRIREIWQGFEIGGAASAQEARGWVMPASYPGASPVQHHQSASSWSA